MWWQSPNSHCHSYPTVTNNNDRNNDDRGLRHRCISSPRYIFILLYIYTLLTTILLCVWAIDTLLTPLSRLKHRSEGCFFPSPTHHAPVPSLTRNMRWRGFCHYSSSHHMWQWQKPAQTMNSCHLGHRYIFLNFIHLFLLLIYVLYISRLYLWRNSRKWAATTKLGPNDSQAIAIGMFLYISSFFITNCCFYISRPYEETTGNRWWWQMCFMI